MGHKCVVPFCKGNYASGPKVSTFSFPKDTELKKKWIAAIHRKNYNPTKHSRVCSLHFQESDFEKEASAYDPKTGKTITAPLQIIRLKKDAVPSIFNVNISNKSPKKTDQEGIVFRNGHSSPRLQQNITNTKLEDIHLTNTMKSNVSVQKEAAVNVKKKAGRKKRKSEAAPAGEVRDSSGKSCMNSNQEASGCNEGKKHCISNSSQCLPAVSIKVEKPWGKEYNYTEKSSEDYNKLQIEIKDVRSVSSNLNMKADKDKSETSESSSIFARPLKILKREEIFGKLVASELSDLCVNPELYLKTKRAILDILVQAHFEQIKCNAAKL